MSDPEVIGPPKRFGQNGINEFFTCQFCHSEKPRGVTDAQYGRIHAGLTSRGLQVWCARHQSNIIHFDFEGVTIKASDSVDAEDRASLLWRMPQLTARLEEAGPMDVVRAGLGVLVARMAIVSPLVRDGGTGSAAELLRAYSIELDRYLFTGEMSPDWKRSYEMIAEARRLKEGGLILPPGS